MNESVYIIDARGLPCPQPYMLAKKALQEYPTGLVEVLVDSEAAKTNVLRVAGYSGRAAEALPVEGGGSRIIIH